MLFIIASASSSSYGQFQGPGVTDKTHSIKEIIKNAYLLDRSDAMVKVQGFIVKQINSDTFEFKDKTGTLKVEIDKKHLPNSPFDDKTELILIGEIDYDLLKPVEMDVNEVQFVESKKAG